MLVARLRELCPRGSADFLLDLAMREDVTEREVMIAYAEFLHASTLAGAPAPDAENAEGVGAILEPDGVEPLNCYPVYEEDFDGEFNTYGGENS